jgi:hypothetical protein
MPITQHIAHAPYRHLSRKFKFRNADARADDAPCGFMRAINAYRADEFIVMKKIS